MSQKERIKKLKRGIQSPETPEHLRLEMLVKLNELEFPEKPPPPPPPKPKPKPKPKPPPPRTFTKEEKEARLKEFREARERKKARQSKDN